MLSAKVREGLDQSDRLVESFLVLARAEAGGLADLETVSLPQLVRAALHARAQATEERNLAVHAQLEQAQAVGSGTLCRPAGGQSRRQRRAPQRPGGMIGITTEVDGAKVRLTVESDGHQIEELVVADSQRCS